MYQIQKWTDRAVEYPRRYREVDAGDGYINHIREPGKVIAEGTPYCAETMNNMEHGIHAGNLLAALLLSGFSAEVLALKEATMPEVTEVTLTNTAKYPFNNSKATIALATRRRTMNYTVDVEVIGDTPNTGEIRVTDKQLNGFKLSYEGSAASATLRLTIKGGMEYNENH